MNKNKQFRFYSFLVVFIVMLTQTSCKSKKVIQTPSESKTPKELIQRFLRQPNYSTISGKAKVSVSSKYGSAKGTMYLRSIKDSLIWIAVKKLSVEGGRVLITKDSIFAINRLEKSYQKHALIDLRNNYGIDGDFEYIQSLILGYNPKVDTSKYWKTEQIDNTLEINTSINSILHKFIIDKMTGDVIGGTFKDQFSADGNWSYKEFDYSIDSIPIPAVRHYELRLGEKEETHSMKIYFSEIEVDISKTIRFSIPDHYTRTY